MDELEKTFLLEIEAEYKKIERKWLFFHYYLSVGLTLVALVAECVFGWAFSAAGVLKTSLSIHVLKFIVAPSVLNGAFLLAAAGVMQSSRLSQRTQAYTVSMLSVLICGVLFTSHRAYAAIFIVFAVPLLLTVVYGDYRLTTATAAATIAVAVLSRLFLKWDVDAVFVIRTPINWGHIAMSVFSLLCFYAICTIIIHFEHQKNDAGMLKELELHKLRFRLQIDELTGLQNIVGARNALMKIERDLSGDKYVFAMLDIDNFKELNDRFGHGAGDACLIEFGKILKAECGGGVPFRYDGDEFCIVFKNAAMKDVLETCKRIQGCVKALRPLPKADPRITASFGVARYSFGMSSSELVSNAGKALYESKRVEDTITVFFDPSAGPGPA